MLERDTRQIALVWFCIFAAMFVLMAGRSAVIRYRHLQKGQLLYGEVVHASSKFDAEYNLVHIHSSGAEIDYVMPHHNMFIAHNRGDIIPFIARPNDKFVQPAAALEYWLSRLEIKASWILITLAVFAFRRGRPDPAELPPLEDRT